MKEKVLEVLQGLTSTLLLKIRFRLRHNGLSLYSDSLDVLVHTKSYLNYPVEEKNDDDDFRIWALSDFAIDCSFLFENAEVVQQTEGGDPRSFCNIGDWNVLWNRRSNSFLFVDISSSRIVIINSDFNSLFYDTYKTIRQVITGRLLLAGGLPLHSSCVSLGGQGISFIGEKGSGKTTLLLQLLLRTGRLSSYISNDLVVAFPGDKSVAVYSFPANAGVGPGTIHSIPQLAAQTVPELHDRAGATARYIYGQNIIDDPRGAFSEIRELPAEEIWTWNKKLWITPMEVATICNTNVANETRLHTIFFPRIRPDKTSIIIEPIDRNALKQLIRDNLQLDYPFPHWLGMECISNQEIGYYVDQLCESMSYVQAYSISAGQDTKAVVNEILKLLNICKLG